MCKKSCQDEEVWLILKGVGSRQVAGVECDKTQLKLLGRHSDGTECADREDDLPLRRALGC